MKIGIIGSGTWGTALGQVLDDNGHEVIIYGNNPNQINDINFNHENSFYFDNIKLSPTIKATLNLKDAIEGMEAILLVVPTSAMRSVLNEIVPILRSKKIFINAAKGFDPSSNKRMSELIREVIPEQFRYPIVTIAGPSHAEEVIIRDLTCVASISVDEEVALKVAKLFSNSYFRVYFNNDEIGSEIGVAMKNSIAICSGILEGLKYGDNSRAALCTRGLAEIARFGVALGANPSTYLGLTGLGDLVVTCYSKHSRNFMAGYQIGLANSAVDFLKNNTKTVEGIRTTKTIYEKGKELGIELPLINCLYEILFNEKKPTDVIPYLMVRPLKNEIEK